MQYNELIFFALKINPVFKNPGINMNLRIPDQTDPHFITFQFVCYDRSTDLEFEVKIQNDPNKKVQLFLKAL